MELKEDKRKGKGTVNELCSFNRNGNCKKNPCAFKHITCNQKDECRKKECKFGHSMSWERRNPGTNFANLEKGIKFDNNSTTELDQEDDNSSISGISISSSTTNDDIDCRQGMSCHEWNCKSRHPSGRRNRCYHGKNCINYSCDYLHPAERIPKCSVECNNFYCEKLHQNRRCKNGGKCSMPDCSYLHPDDRNFCDNENCEDVLCLKIHPSRRRQVCQFGTSCKNIKCTFLHPSSRHGVCPMNLNCAQFVCQLLHSKGRPKLCNFRDRCRNKDCEYLHPEDCPKGGQCENIENKMCYFRHPLLCRYAIRCKNESCERYHPDGWDPNNTFPGITLKTFYTRNNERQTSRKLPIFKCYDEFISRLEKHKVLIVTAATGSGKTTQLPQFAAEKFGGLVVCTQPRVLAAVTLADRIAQEFDGETVGYNVGYKVGGGQAKDGKLIMLMTDSTLVRMAQQDSLLSKIKKFDH